MEAGNKVDRILEAVASLNKRLDAFRDDAHEIRTALSNETANRKDVTRWLSIALGLVFLLVLGFGFLAWQTREERIHADRVTCEQRNDSRLGIRRAVLSEGESLVGVASQFAGPHDPLTIKLAEEQTRIKAQMVSTLPITPCP